MKKEKSSHLQTITTLFDSTWVTYKKTFSTLFKVNVLPVSILASISLITAYVATYYADMFKQIKDAAAVVTPMDASSAHTLGALGAKALIDYYMPDIINYFAIMFGFFCISVLVSSLAYVTQIKAIDTLSNGSGDTNNDISHVSIIELYRSSAKFVTSYIWVAILVFIAVFGGFILLIVPGVVFSVWFSMCTFVLILQGEKGKSALLKSKAYVRGIWTHVFFRILAIVGFMILVSIARGVFQGFLSGVLSTSLHTRFFIDVLFQLIVSPFFIVYLYELFKDIVRANESVDTSTDMLVESDGDGLAA